MNILLVEDNVGDVELMKLAFKQGSLSSELSVVHDGVEAIEYLSQHDRFKEAPKPDLILLDLNMPRMSGRQFLEVVKQSRRFRAIPILILSTSHSQQDVRECYTRHANGYIIKPYDSHQFMRFVCQIDKFWQHVVRLPKKSDNTSFVDIL